MEQYRFTDPTSFIESSTPGTIGVVTSVNGTVGTVKFRGESYTGNIVSTVFVGDKVNVVILSNNSVWLLPVSAGYPSAFNVNLSEWKNKAPASLLLRYAMRNNKKLLRYQEGVALSDSVDGKVLVETAFGNKLLSVEYAGETQGSSIFKDDVVLVHRQNSGKMVVVKGAIGIWSCAEFMNIPDVAGGLLGWKLSPKVVNHGNGHLDLYFYENFGSIGIYRTCKTVSFNSGKTWSSVSILPGFDIDAKGVDTRYNTVVEAHIDYSQEEKQTVYRNRIVWDEILNAISAAGIPNILLHSFHTDEWGREFMNIFSGPIYPYSRAQYGVPVIVPELLSKQYCPIKINNRAFIFTSDGQFLEYSPSTYPLSELSEVDLTKGESAFPEGTSDGNNLVPFGGSNLMTSPYFFEPKDRYFYFGMVDGNCYRAKLLLPA